MDYLNGLNDKQREAALHKEGPLLILAGAGSGKTSTMTRRIAHLIKNEGVSPYHIFAVTFTNKAAKEMRDRVESLVGEGLNMWILTFHSACLRILRKYAERLGYTNDFVVYDPTDQKTVIKNCIKAANIDDKKFTPAYVLSVISDNKEKAVSPQEFMRLNEGDFKGKILAGLYSEYCKILKKNNAMDFDDLIVNTVRLFEADEEVLLYYQKRFAYIMVDEYQDTNYMQYRFIRLLAEAHNNICVVGDDDQCIYQWRGADITNILDFEKDFKNTKVIKLEQNYRSYGNILAAAHSVVERNMQRKHKKLWTDKEPGEKICYYRADDEKDEARYVAQEIDRLKTKERQYKDFAILYRTNAQSRTFEEALSAREIPYRVLGGLRYYDRKEIKDIMSYMRLVQNPADDVSFARIINEPKRGIGDKTVEKLRTLAQVRGESLFETLTDQEVVMGLPSKAIASVQQMVDTILKYSEEKANLRVSDIYDGVLVNTGYLKALEDANTVEAESRIENIMEFKSVIYDYEKEDPQLSLSDFMERIALVAEVDNHDENENAVVLMTMHSAKGLEFPVVFLPGMEDGLFPGWRSLDTPTGLEEERRLCYVGMTRAKERLFMTSAQMRTMYGKTDYTRESQFIREVDKSLLEGDAVYEKKPAMFSTGAGSSFGNSWGGGSGFGGTAAQKAPSSRIGGNDGFAKASPAMPFDPLAASRQESKRSGALNQGKDFQSGDRVNHAKFGEGMVVAVEGKTISVMFDSAGLKKLAKDIAPIKKI
ncbi:UvrD-helicase domain-containing protein [Aminipila butyrica]|uniref:DNA 3'-5' helicase n=1 Tax=Aminipila butyrica TaxID=433296 RepID=A0A858BVW9_9FIRM|nr:UvrD-helicase domain-containing protein [Aminipila butyrica]QIB70211.1 UvrD-helicase domain-containing protein [Aminipila butyrica]